MSNKRGYDSPIAFEFTSQARDWYNSVKIDGPCSIYDRWTYGRQLLEMIDTTYYENGIRKPYRGLSIKTY